MQPVATSVSGGRGRRGRTVAVEETVIHILDLPAGQDWVWFADGNIIGLSRRLDEAGREAALCDLQATWRRSLIRVA